MFTKISNRFFLLLFSILLLSSSAKLYGQISKGGTPPSIIYGVKSSASVKDFTPKLDLTTIKAEDGESHKMGKPMRAGISVPVNLGINDSGEWAQLPDGRMLWRLTLKADGAYALGIVFSKYKLPEESELYLYDINQQVILGAFDNQNNNDARVLSTRVLPGSEIVIEYVESPSIKYRARSSNPEKMEVTPNVIDPKTYKSDATLCVGELVYTYLDAFVFGNSYGSKPSTGSSIQCMVNINCSPVGDSYQIQKRGVAHMFFPIGTNWYFCTGDLVNNTHQDGTPYFLTACHCGQGSTATDHAKWQFYFNYEYEGCENSGTPNTGDVLTGCTYRASGPLDGGSDFYLVELNNKPPSSYNVYYNGWSREETGASFGAGIHHPAGDVKKISTFNTQLTPSQATFSGVGTTATNSLWKILWSENENGWGVSEGGSSGSPLFNENGLQVGTLSGGSSSCSTPTNNDYYGRFSYHWASNGTSDTSQLAPWLDPSGTNQVTLGGYDPNITDELPIANFTFSPSTVKTGDEVSFIDASSYAPNAWKWSFENGYPTTSNSRMPKVTWVTPGNHTITLISSNVNGSGTITRSINVSARELPTSNPVVIGTETNTTMYPFGINGTTSGAANRVRSASIYTAEELGGAGQISKLEWYVGTPQADSRSVVIYMKETSLSSFTACTQNDIIADATLVYSGTLTPNATGWTGFELNKKFQYQGNKNLIVMVYTNSTATTNLSSNCYYTPSEGKHQFWKARNTNPTNNGTINAFRPNIRVTFEAFEAPEALFGTRSAVFTETFESGTFPPAGWTVINTDGAGKEWTSSTNFNNTKNGQTSAVHFYGASSYTEEGWLITPQITLPADGSYQLSFYSYNKDYAYYSSGRSSVLISTTGTTPSDFVQIWTPSSVNEKWVESTVDLSSYAGQSIYIAFLYEGTYAHTWYLDDVSVYKIERDAISINEGESVTIYNTSTGDPIVYQWQTPEATVTESYDYNVTPTYNVAGRYDVSLMVGSTAGENKKIVSGYVTVNGQTPTADFSGKGNLKTESFLPFIPAGAAVNYTDASTNIPTTWNWSFNGGTPATSSKQNPEVAYSTEGLYDVSLTASNKTGSNTTSLSGFVKVGGTDFASNQLKDDQIMIYTLTNGYMPGHGDYIGSSHFYFYQYAEYYTNSYNGKISAIKVLVNSNKGTGKYVTFHVWDGSTGVPGTILASKEVEIASLTAEENNVITLDAPVSVTGNFFVGFEVTYDTSHDFSTHCFSVKLAYDRNTNATSWVKWGTSAANAAWSSISDVFGIETSMCIYPYFTYTNEVSTYALALEADPIAGGTVTDNTNASPYAEGTAISLSAVPNNGYTFTNWKNGDSEVSTSKDFTFTMPAANTTLTACFSKTDGVNELEGKSNSITVYPNPAAGAFTIQINLAASLEAEVLLSDLTGRTIMQTPRTSVSQGIHNITFTPIAGLKDGLYIVSVRGYTKEGGLTLMKDAKLIFMNK